MQVNGITRLLSLSLMGLSVAACAAQPMVSVREGQSLARYTVIEVPPVTNDTGRTFAFDPTAVLTDDLRAELRSRGRTVVAENGPPAETLVLKCSLLSFQEGSPAAAWVGLESGQAKATVRTTLIDKATDKVIGTMVTPITRAELLYGYATRPERGILSQIAKGIANETSEQMSRR